MPFGIEDMSMPVNAYNTDDADGLALWEAVNGRFGRLQITGMKEEPARFGEPHLVRPGQGAFRLIH